MRPAKNRRPHFSTCRRARPVNRPVSEIDWPSANNKITRPRRDNPARIVVARCHDSNSARSSSLNFTANAVLRPRAIAPTSCHVYCCSVQPTAHPPSISILFSSFKLYFILIPFLCWGVLRVKPSKTWSTPTAAPVSRFRSE